MRDMTEKQYRAALDRVGCKPCGLGRLWVECEEFPHSMFGVVYNMKTGRIARRATIKRLHAQIKRERQRRAEWASRQTGAAA